MTEKLQQTIREEIAKLPKEKQQAINSIDWARLAEEIGKKFLLLESEISDLQAETGLVLIGLFDIESYRRNIENNIGLSNVDAKKISDEAMQKIFTPIADKIESSVKDNLSSKKQDFSQTVKFILSGGDYSYFLDNK